MSQFQFSLFYVKEEKGPILKKQKQVELTQQIVTDLLLFIMVNMWERKHKCLYLVITTPKETFY